MLEQYHDMDEEEHDSVSNNTDNTARNEKEESDINNSGDALEQENKNDEDKEVSDIE